MTSPNIITAAVILIGDELLSGRTKDANLNHLAKWLTGRGIKLCEARVIADIPEVIVNTVNELRSAYDYVFTTGGIGPTHDDITAENVAKAFGVDFGLNQEAFDILIEHYGGEEHVSDARRRMAMTPKGAVLIDNPVSRAPGFQIENVFVMAGIPAVMQAMLKDVETRITSGDTMLSMTMHVYVGESHFADILSSIEKDYPDVQVGSYPFYTDGKYGANFVLRSYDQENLSTAYERLKVLISEQGRTAIDGELGK